MAKTSPAQAMCLVSSNGRQIVSYLRRDWPNGRKMFTTRLSEAWQAADKASLERVVTATTGIAEEAAGVGRLELRKVSSCPREIRLG